MSHLLIALALVAAQPLSQAPLAGAWQGTIDVPAARLTLNIEVVFRTEGDGLLGTIDIPQGATGLALRAITVNGSAVRFDRVDRSPCSTERYRATGSPGSSRRVRGAARSR